MTSKSLSLPPTMPQQVMEAHSYCRDSQQPQAQDQSSTARVQAREGARGRRLRCGHFAGGPLRASSMSHLILIAAVRASHSRARSAEIIHPLSGGGPSSVAGGGLDGIFFT